MSYAELVEASGAKILVALGPHPQLDIWQKALQVRDRVPGLTLLRVAPPGTPAEAELREHAEQTIAERPAWPRHIHVVDAIPVTSVGKIYKPELRGDATTRLVRQVVQGELGLGAYLFDVEVSAR